MKSFKEILGKTNSFNHLDHVRKISAMLHSSYKIEVSVQAVFPTHVM
jgi:hypothetical protein